MSHASNNIRIGWVGLGPLGYSMVKNLAKNLPDHLSVTLPVLVWNRSSEKASTLLSDLGDSRVAIAESPEEIVTTCDVVFTTLASDDVVNGIYGRFVEALKAITPSKDKIFVEMSTIYPKTTGELDRLISSLPHCRFVASPVFGAPPAAAAAQLLIYMAGDAQAKETIASLLVPAVGRKVNDLGADPEKAPTFKVIGNSMILGSMEIIAEAYTIATKAGIDQAAVNEYIKDMFPAPSWLLYGDRMLHHKFDGRVGFSIDGAIKDASHMRRLAAETDAPMPAIDVAYQHLLTARALHRAGNAEEFPVLDWSALVAGARVAAGLSGLREDEGSAGAVQGQ